MIKSEDLRARWDPKVVESINQSLGKGKSIESPFGNIDGRVDLRGLVIREFIKGKTIESYDFSAAIREGFGQIDMSTLIDCLFSGATIDTNLGTRFERCAFDAAQMNGAILRGAFTDCLFLGANLTSASGSSVKFERCIFERANLRKAQLTGCRFVDCSFADARFRSGSLASSYFVGGSPTEAQVGNTLMRGCSFAGIPE